MSGGVSFDRAADFYDKTRGLPDDIRDRVADMLVDELADRGTCLEIGVGTGRVALPLHAREISLVGTDLARAMLERLVANAGGAAPFPLTLADATRLPYDDGSFGAVLACHVFHLIAAWRDAVDEVMRVLRPGGVLLIDFGGVPWSPWRDSCHEIFERHGVAALRPGTSSHEEIAAHLGGRATVRALVPVEMTVRRRLQQDLDDCEQQIPAWTWAYAPEELREACVAIRAWAAEEAWPLDREVDLARTIQWWAFERPQ
jgi:ubiquinone/menaquinone biosynthesis C-methylase UbiE